MNKTDFTGDRLKNSLSPVFLCKNTGDLRILAYSVFCLLSFMREMWYTVSVCNGY